MEFKPTRRKAEAQPRLDGMGRMLGADTKNPFATIARGLDAGGTGKRRRFAADTIGATPPRDGPFAAGAADVAVAKPPRTRSREQRLAGGAQRPFGVLPRGQTLKP